MLSVLLRWQGFLANPNYIREGNSITWPNRLRVDPGNEEDLLATLAEQRQYSLQIVPDGSLLQFYYAFSRGGDKLEKGSLAFYYAGAHSEMSEIESAPEEGVVPL